MTGARVIDGREVAQRVRAEVAERAASFAAAQGRPPCLATVLVGEDPPSQAYIRGKQTASAEVGIASRHTDVPGDATEAEVLDLVAQLGADDGVDGILVQLPLPGHIDAQAVIEAIPADKDVDGLTPANAGGTASGVESLASCTPVGVVRLLEEYEVPITGANVVVVGRSNLVGRPLAMLLLNRHATVTIAHSRTRDLGAHTRAADIVIMAVGRLGLLTGDMVRDGAVVIDVGTNRTDEGLRGDVAFDEVAEKAALITPVPGGVGPMTIASLLSNTVLAAELRAARSAPA